MPLLDKLKRKKKEEFEKVEPTEEEYAEAEEPEEPEEEEYEEEVVGEEPKLKPQLKKEEGRLMKEVERLTNMINELKAEQPQPSTPTRLASSPSKRLRPIQQSPVQQPRKVEVVKELPLHPIRQYKDEDGNMVELMTVEEAMTQILNE